MKYLKWFLYAFTSLLIDCVSRPFLNWIVVLFSDSKGNLPGFLKYWQTFDNDLYAGQHEREKEILTGEGETWRWFVPLTDLWFYRYWNRAFWLLRNSCYGFSYYLFGVDWHKETWRVVKYDDTSERTFFFAVSGDAFNLYYHGPLGMYKIGWKAWNMFDTVTNTFTRDAWGDGGKIPHVVSANPFKRKQ